MTNQTQVRRASLPAKMLEAGLWLAALGCGATGLTWVVEAHAAQHEAAQIEPAATAQAPAESAKSGQILGRIEIDQLHFSAPILENYDPATLTRGVGHIPGTAVPGGLGNLVLAGHRDTFFRPLRNVRAGMLIQIITTQGRWRYAVDRTEIVTPDRVDMLDIGDRPEMTLITCFPFDYIGAAPRRFIVHAHLLSVDAG
jgi:sortase A